LGLEGRKEDSSQKEVTFAAQSMLREVQITQQDVPARHGRYPDRCAY
jgi:hypothetical protein